MEAGERNRLSCLPAIREGIHNWNIIMKTMPDKSLQATGAAPFRRRSEASTVVPHCGTMVDKMAGQAVLDGVGDSLLPGFVGAQSPAAVPELGR
jgi:hypothetical protein